MCLAAALMLAKCSPWSCIVSLSLLSISRIVLRSQEFDCDDLFINLLSFCSTTTRFKCFRHVLLELQALVRGVALLQVNTAKAMVSVCFGSSFVHMEFTFVDKESMSMQEFCLDQQFLVGVSGIVVFVVFK